MDPSNLSILLKKAVDLDLNISIEQIAHFLGVTTRTIAQWEKGKNCHLSLIEQDGIMRIFHGIIIKQVQQSLEEIYQAIPSELVSLWIVQKDRFDSCDKVVCLPRCTRLETHIPKYLNTSIIMHLSDISLTTYPLKQKDTLNLAGDYISNSKFKRNKGHRSSYFSATGICHSLIHTGFHYGETPVCMLSLENKLNNDKVIEWNENIGEYIYSKHDVETAEKFVKNLGNKIYLDMITMGMLVIN